MYHKLWLFLGAINLFFVGCTATVPEIAKDHPAHPQAQEVPFVNPVDVFAEGFRPKLSTPQSSSQHHHHHHRTDQSSPEKREDPPQGHHSGMHHE